RRPPPSPPPGLRHGGLVGGSRAQAGMPGAGGHGCIRPGSGSTPWSSAARAYCAWASPTCRLRPCRLDCELLRKSWVTSAMTTRGWGTLSSWTLGWAPGVSISNLLPHDHAVFRLLRDSRYDTYGWT